MSIDHTHTPTNPIFLQPKQMIKKRKTLGPMHIIYYLFSGIRNYIILFDTVQGLILDLMMSVEKISR